MEVLNGFGKVLGGSQKDLGRFWKISGGSMGSVGKEVNVGK